VQPFVDTLYFMVVSSLYTVTRENHECLIHSDFPPHCCCNFLFINPVK
jgi:hypothetical protein